MKNIRKNELHIYNQNISNDFSADCTIFTQAQIIGLTYDIWLEYTTLNSMVDYMISKGKLLSWGASFRVIYWASAFLFSRKIKETIEVKKLSIYSKEFEDMMSEGYFFGLGLKNGNPRYLDQVRQGDKFSKEDIDEIVEFGGGFGHNHCYGLHKGKYYIFEIYEGKKIEMPLEVLRYAVSKNLYFVPARTFILRNYLLKKYLFNYRDGVVTDNVQDLPKESQQAIAKASRLRVFKKN